jgi:formate hydrogenlyase subunit 3/multisubunit Na+/H+ antiporter MnhD subunit
MYLLLISLGIIISSGTVALLFCTKPRLSSYLGAGGAVVGCIIGIIPALRTLYYGTYQSLRRVWDIPYGSFFIQIDPLSAFFLLPIFALSALAAVYGTEYLMAYREKKWLGISWFSFNMLLASMVLVCLARNAVLFLISWEIMAISSFFLVAFESEKEEVRKSSWTYLVATYLGTVCLLPMFLIFGTTAGSLDFDMFAHRLSPQISNICFVLALIGFGTKAGIMPFHVWLPEAHPAAPSHVSTLMSGIMIKTGIYGLIRILSYMGTPPLWWGWLLVGIGAISGVIGVLFALTKHDFKRILAYSSVENIGVIMMGLGVGMIGWSAGMTSVAAIGFAGGLLHVVNHAMFKGLLFLGAGSIFHATHTREIERLGGLIKKMPYTGTCFLIGSIAISGLPPFNGFISEFMIYIGSFQGAASMKPDVAMPMMVAIAALALIGGLAAACFTNVFGIIFLGEPRSDAAKHAHESGKLMTIPILILAAGCVITGLAGSFVIQGLCPVVSGILKFDSVQDISQAAVYLRYVTGGSVIFIILLSLLIWIRYTLLSGREVGKSLTWDCGYAAPSARMQYTASSYTQPISYLFQPFLRTEKHLSMTGGYFPSSAHLDTYTPDISREQVYKPVFTEIGKFFSRLKVLQQGRIQIYVLYVVGALLVLLIWNMR